VAAYVFYFANRPLAQLDTGHETFTLLTTDHLAVPILATNTASALSWQGGYEPFGGDYSGADDAGIFLRFPGQWQAESWAESSSDGATYYNVHRWYQARTGRYTRADPTGFEGSPVNWYIYAEASPIRFIDFLGLTSYKGFSGDQQRKIEDAVERAKQKIQTTCCAGSLSAPLLDLLEKTTFVFKPSLKVCGRVTPLGKLNMNVQISGLAFDRKKCCLLESTVVHEVNHLRWSDSGQEVSFKLEKDCFGCG
jgi:RHS repeat-associated protein